MRRTIVVLACLAAAAVGGCSSGQDGTDVTGRSAADPASVTAQPPAPKPSDYPTDTSPAPAETTAGPKTWAMGYRSTIFDDTKTDILHLAIASPRNLPADPYLKPDHGRFLAVTVTYEALAPAQPINPYDLLAVTSSGERLQPTFGPDTAGSQLQYATLNTGEKAKGTVVFDVPKTGVVGIAYAPSGQILGTWTLT
jgi:uncharacterized protein DUF4352